MARKKRRRPHGMGCVYQRGPGNWWIKWREGSRIRYAHGYATREQAEEVRDKIVADVAAGRAGLPPDPDSIPHLGDLATAWLERRKQTHRAADSDEGRWNNHLKPFFGKLRPAEVDAAEIRRFVETKLAAGLNPATVGHCVRLLSTLFTDVVEQGYVSINPVRTLPRSTRRLFRPTSDPRNTPFLETQDDVRAIFLRLPRPIDVAFAIGALGGLRTGEVLGLEWRDIDLANRRINVRHQMQDGRLTTLKDDESRVVPIMKSLAPLLTEYHLETGGEGLLFRAGWNGLRGGTENRAPTFVRPHTLHNNLRKAFAKIDEEEAKRRAKAGLPPKETTRPVLTWYQCTRHTFASHWVLSGGSIEKLALVMGHSSTVVTQRYAHMRPELFREADYQVIDIDLRPNGKVVSLPVPKAKEGAVGYAVVTRKKKRENARAITA